VELGMQDTEYRLQKVNLMYEAKHETAMNHKPQCHNAKERKSYDGEG
jgi:hypothetical protein